MYNFKNSLTRLRVNRFIAMKRFLGGCLDTVALKTGLLECFMGLQNIRDQLLDKVTENQEAARERR